MRIVAMVLLICSSVAAQTRSTARATSRAVADQLGLTCAQILEMTSAEWVLKFTSEKGSDSSETIRAVDAYGKCYDARTDQLAAKLSRAAKGPSPGARGNFQSLEQALKSFTAKALAESQPSADPVKSVYAALYEKQFRYEFYESYERKAASPLTTASSPRGPSGGVADQKSPANDVASSTPDATAPSKRDTKNSQARDVDPLTAAKNHFGELLGDLPDQQMHDLHESFGEILGPNSASLTMQLLVYRYAIFLLEPPGGTPFSPPPF